MRTFLRCTLIAASLLGAWPVAQAAGTVEVSWREPATFSDAGPSVMDREHVMRTLGQHMVRLGRLLPDGQTLKLEVTDLDLAGQMEWRRGHEVRVLRNRADWPRMSLHYTLSAGGSTLKSGDADLSDMAYLFNTRRDELDYEQRMVEKWVKEMFVAK